MIVVLFHILHYKFWGADRLLYDIGSQATSKDSNRKIVPTQPFRILDAPLLRDDYYCSILAYSSTSGYLAVGLGHRVYLWCEALGVQHPPLRDQHHSNWVTSLSFSSDDGGKSILAVSRRTGMLSLWSTLDPACVSKLATQALLHAWYSNQTNLAGHRKGSQISRWTSRISLLGMTRVMCGTTQWSGRTESFRTGMTGVAP